MIITSGAVSAGKFDYIPNIIKKLNLANYFKGVAIRPGKPLLFAKIRRTQNVVFGLLNKLFEFTTNQNLFHIYICRC